MCPARPVAARLRSIFAGAALSTSAGACATPATKSLPPVEEPPPAEYIEVAEPRAQPIERSPAEDWIQAVAELDALARGPADATREAELRTRATDALQALEDDDPRVLEILCRAALSGWFSREREALWTRAAALAASHGPDPRARYASLSRDTLRLFAPFGFASYESLLTSRVRRAWTRPDYPRLTRETCASADRASLSLALALAVVPARAVYEQLHVEVVRELGADDPAVATVLDWGHALCSGETGTDACLPPLRRFERSLTLRERALGPDHPLTNASRLNLAIVLEEAGARRRSEALLRDVAGSSVRDRSTIFALRELAGRELRRRKWRAAAELFADASSLARELLDPGRDGPLITETRRLHAHALAYAGDYAGAEAAFRGMRADDPLGDPRDFSYPIAEVLRAAGKYTEAVAYYDESIAAWQANTTPVDFAIAALIRGHRGRAAALARLGRTDESRADLAAAKRLTARSRE